VGPPDYPGDPGRRPALEQFEVFRVGQGQAVLLTPGVWHGAPMAVERPLQAIVLLHENTGRDDTVVVHFEPVTVA
jgi:hypothetical protein